MTWCKWREKIEAKQQETTICLFGMQVRHYVLCGCCVGEFGYYTRRIEGNCTFSNGTQDWCQRTASYHGQLYSKSHFVTYSAFSLYAL